MSLSKLIVSLLAVVALTVDLGAQSVNSVTPSEGSVSSILTIEFSGDVGKGKPKVWLTLAGDESKKPKKYKCKTLDVVSAPGSATITAELKKAVVGTFDVVVKPKVKGGGEVVAMSAFEVNAPSVQTGPTPATAEPGDEVTMTLLDLGNKPPKLTIGGKKTKAKITSGVQGEPQTITFKIPKSLANGNWPVIVDNKVGQSDGETTVEVTGSNKKIGKSFLTATVSGVGDLKYKGKKLSGENVGDSLQILATSLTNPSKSITVIVPFVDVGTFTQFSLPLGASIGYTEASAGAGGSFSAKTWQTSIPPIEVVISAISGGQFAGSFTGELVSNNGDPNITISGEFVVDT